VISVRAAVTRDADAICDAQVDAWRTAYRGLFRDEYLDAAEFDASRRARWRGWEWVHSYGGEVLVPVVDGDVVGFAHIGAARVESLCDQSGTEVEVDVASGCGEVYGFYLHPRAWGSGAGEMLMTAALGRLRDTGYERAVLWVLRDNPRARRFYEKCGWSSRGATSGWAPPGEVEVPEVRYEITVDVRSAQAPTGSRR
jgi:GNAT superfamily N-acetyltransferase